MTAVDTHVTRTVPQQAGSGDDLVRMAAHELRQPLATIQALVESVTVRDDLPADLARTLDGVQEQTRHLIRTVRDLLVSSAGLEIGDVDLTRVARGVETSFRLTWTGHLELEADPHVVVRADAEAIRRCLTNVVANACHAAGPDGTVRIRLVETSGWVDLEVEDDGPGMGNVPTQHALGLLLVRRDLDLVGGHLEVGRSTTLGGACARIALRRPTPA